MNPGRRSSRFRVVAWTLSAAGTGAYGLYVASEPWYQITSCETASEVDRLCSTSLWAHYGTSLLAVLAVAVIGCAVPAVWSARVASRLAVAILIADVALTFLLFQEMLFLYFIPVAVGGWVVHLRVRERRARPGL